LPKYSLIFFLIHISMVLADMCIQQNLMLNRTHNVLS
jgi:hypothetical protein